MVVDRLAEAGTPFISLATRSGTPVRLRPTAISWIRQALPINGPGTEIVVGGQYQHVSQSVDVINESRA